METQDGAIEQMLDELVEREGGFVDHPADRGGATRYGITEAVARAHGYRGAMRALPRSEAVDIYRRLYWLRPRFDAVAMRAPRIAAELFDTSVNMGPAVAVTFLQRALTRSIATGPIIPTSCPTGASANRRWLRSTPSLPNAGRRPGLVGVGATVRKRPARPSCCARSRRCRAIRR